MEYARDLADQLEKDGGGPGAGPVRQRRQPRIHFRPPAPRSGRTPKRQITHFVSAMGTTGTITGTSRFPQVAECQREDRRRAAQRRFRILASANGRRPICPRFYDASLVDELVYVSQSDAGEHGPAHGPRGRPSCSVASSARRAGRRCRSPSVSENATIVFVVCDRGDRYLDRRLSRPDRPASFPGVIAMQYQREVDAKGVHCPCPS